MATQVQNSLPLFEQKSSTPVEVRESCTYGDFALKTAQVVDPCASKHGGDEASVRAWKQIEPVVKDHELHVLRMIVSVYPNGLTSSQISEAWGGKSKNEFSGRLTSLKNAGAIYKTGDLIDGCGVWRATERGIKRVRKSL
jgi:hypothetical protein